MSGISIPGFNPETYMAKAKELMEKSGGNSDFVYASDYFKNNNNVLCFRLVVDPRLGLDGGLWLDKYDFKVPQSKFSMLNPSTVGLPDPFTPIWSVAKAQAATDPNMKELVEAKDANHIPKVGPQAKVIFPVLMCHPTGSVGTPINNEIKLLECPTSLAAKVIQSMTLEINMQDGVSKAIHPTMGVAMYIQKTGAKLDTTYTVQPVGTPMGIPQAALEKVPNIKEILSKWVKPYNHLQSLLNNYLYGTPILPEGVDDAPVSGPIAGAAAQPVVYGNPMPNTPAQGIPQQPQQMGYPQTGQPVQAPPMQPNPQGIPNHPEPVIPTQQVQQPVRNVMDDMNLNNLGR